MIEESVSLKDIGMDLFTDSEGERWLIPISPSREFGGRDVIRLSDMKVWEASTAWDSSASCALVEYLKLRRNSLPQEAGSVIRVTAVRASRMSPRQVPQPGLYIRNAIECFPWVTGTANGVVVASDEEVLEWNPVDIIDKEK